MNCYKLKKVYPFSPPLGTEIMYNGKYWICNKPIQGYSQFNKHISEFNPQDYPEFWEKVVEKECTCGVFDCCSNLKNCKILASKQPKIVEKDYEILSFTNYTGQISTKRKNGLFLNSICNNEYGVYAAEHHISKWDIHSVKRLSDGEIFTVGDFVDINNAIGDCNKHLTITGFNIGNVLSVLTNNKINNKYAGHKGFNISIAEHSKRKPLFKTEDGVDIYEGDLMFYVYTGNAKCNKGLLYTIKKINADKHLNYCVVTEGKYFSNKEAAEEYILINKPCLSIKEIAPIFGMYHLDNSKTSLDRLSEKLKELVKGRI